jgi:Rod binding domain-containing protein
MTPKVLNRNYPQNALSKEEARRPYEKVAEGMETQFINHMIKEMRKGVPKEDQDSSAMNYYNSVMDYERSKILASDPRGGIGIKKMILEQMLPEHLKDRPVPKQEISAYMKQKNLKENSHE